MAVSVFFSQLFQKYIGFYSMGFVSGEYTVNSTEADENTPLNSSSRRHRLREPFSCHHLLLFGFLLLLLAEVVVLQLCGIFVLPSLSYDESENSTFPECFPDSFLGAAISLSVIETVNCCIFVIIMKKSLSVSICTVLKDLLCLPKFWTLILFYVLYVIGASLAINEYNPNDISDCYPYEAKLVKAQIGLEMPNLFSMMVLVLLLNYTNVRETKPFCAWVLLKGALILFCFCFFATVVFNMIRVSTALISVPAANRKVTKALIINDVLVLPFCRKIVELLWKKLFFDEKRIIGKIRRNSGTRQITFVV